MVSILKTDKFSFVNTKKQPSYLFCFWIFGTWNENAVNEHQTMGKISKTFYLSSVGTWNKSWAQFCCKMRVGQLGVKPWSSDRCRSVLCILIPNFISRGVLRATPITLCFVLADDLHLIYLYSLLDTVLWFSLLPLTSYLDVNEHSNIVEHIIWVLLELSVGEHKMLNRIGRTCMSLLQ